jgi:hypothetical protein
VLLGVRARAPASAASRPLSSTTSSDFGLASRSYALGGLAARSPGRPRVRRAVGAACARRVRGAWLWARRSGFWRAVAGPRILGAEGRARGSEPNTAVWYVDVYKYLTYIGPRNARKRPDLLYPHPTRYHGQPAHTHPTEARLGRAGRN